MVHTVDAVLRPNPPARLAIGAFSIHAQCEAKFDPPPEIRRERVIPGRFNPSLATTSGYRVHRTVWATMLPKGDSHMACGSLA